MIKVDKSSLTCTWYSIPCDMSLEGPAPLWKNVKPTIHSTKDLDISKSLIHLLEIHYFNNMFLQQCKILMYTIHMVPKFGVHKYFQAAVYPLYSVYLEVVPPMSQRLIEHHLWTCVCHVALQHHRTGELWCFVSCLTSTWLRLWLVVFCFLSVTTLFLPLKINRTK